MTSRTRMLATWGSAFVLTGAFILACIYGVSRLGTFPATLGAWYLGVVFGPPAVLFILFGLFNLLAILPAVTAWVNDVYLQEEMRQLDEH